MTQELTSFYSPRLIVSNFTFLNTRPYHERFHTLRNTADSSRPDTFGRSPRQATPAEASSQACALRWHACALWCRTSTFRWNGSPDHTSHSTETSRSHPSCPAPGRFSPKTSATHGVSRSPGTFRSQTGASRRTGCAQTRTRFPANSLQADAAGHDQASGRPRAGIRGTQARDGTGRP